MSYTFDENNRKSNFGSERRQENGGFNKGGFNKGGFGGKPAFKSNYDGNPIVYFPFTFVGSKDVPEDQLHEIRSIVEALTKCKDNDCSIFVPTCRTSVTSNAEVTIHDLLKESNPRALELYLPWKEFKDANGTVYDSKQSFPTPESIDIASRIHDAWDKLQEWMHKIMAKNVRVITGQNMRSPSKFVLCWTPDGVERYADRSKGTYGVDFYLRIAECYRIPVYNINNPSGNVLERIAKDFNLSL